MAITDKLTAVADAIRDKTGKTELMTLAQMPDEIASITTGGGGGIEVEPIVLTGDCSYACSGVIASKYIELFGDNITTNKLLNSDYMFRNYKNETIPFEINYDPSSGTHTMRNMFQSAYELITPPKINNVKPSALNYLFSFCSNLKEIPEDYFDNWDWSYHQSGSVGAYSAGQQGIFERCYSLRKVPMKLFNNFQPNASNMYSYFYGGFSYCHNLDELIDLPIPYTAEYTSNMFYNTFYNCQCLKNMTFETNEDGSPLVKRWKSQTIDLSNNVGYANGYTDIVAYNSGRTPNERVYDDATYQAVKDNPDWYAVIVDYSRYNHDSAVRTINSLPDTSAYGTNTIKFKGAAGALNGGAINTLTEEEIAVATAKGWTVSFS